MIIDEILDNRYNGTVRFKDLDLAYIREEANLFDFDYLVEAIDLPSNDEKRKEKIIEALKTYLSENKYDHLEIRFI